MKFHERVANNPTLTAAEKYAGLTRHLDLLNVELDALNEDLDLGRASDWSLRQIEATTKKRDKLARFAAIFAP